MIELTTYDEIPTGSLRDEWDDLVAVDPFGTFFHTPGYLAVWQQELGKRVDPRIRFVRRDGRLIGVIPEGRELEGSVTGPVELIRFLGGTEVTDYLGPVSHPDERDAVAKAYLDALVEDRNWDEFVASGLAEDSGWVDALSFHAERVGLTAIETTTEDVCPRVDIAGGYEQYLAELPSKLRHEVRRKARKLSRDAGQAVVRDVEEKHLQAALDRFFEMASESEDEKSRFFVGDEMRSFFGALLDRFANDGTIRLHELEVAGQPGAAAISIVHDGEWSLYNSAFDPALATLAPGMVLVGELIRISAEEGHRTFDLLRGDEPYKYRFGAEDRVLLRVTITRS